jgi:hypothetical protein
MTDLQVLWRWMILGNMSRLLTTSVVKVNNTHIVAMEINRTWLTLGNDNVIRAHIVNSYLALVQFKLSEQNSCVGVGKGWRGVQSKPDTAYWPKLVGSCRLDSSSLSWDAQCVSKWIWPRFYGFYSVEIRDLGIMQSFLPVFTNSYIWQNQFQKIDNSPHLSCSW